MTRVRVQVDDGHGTVALYVDAPDPEQAAVCAQVWAAAHSDAISEALLRLAVIADLTRLVADDEAYQRECQRRGLIPI